MDNITHSLIGLTLAETGLKRATPLATVTLVVAANFPDIDIITGLVGSLFYLEHHRGITHALAALPILSLLLAAGIYAYSRRKNSGARFRPLFGLSLLGMLTHPLLDYLNSYGWRPFLPWDDRWFYGDIAFVIDPWLWILLGGALFVTTAKTRGRMIAWAVLFTGLLAAVLLPSGLSVGIKAVWGALVAVAVGLRLAIRATERAAVIVSLSMIVAVLAYLGMMMWLHRVALEKTRELALAAQRRDGGSQVHTGALPTPANPLVWRAVVATSQAYYISDLRLSGPLPALEEMTRYRRESGDTELLEAARSTAQAQTFLRFARFPVSEVITLGTPDAPAEVEIRDVRFQNLGVTNRFHTLIQLDKNLRPVVEQ
jgi:inner membrane protein